MIASKHKLPNCTMSEFSAENSTVGEDWESECCESAASGLVVRTLPAERDDISEYKPLTLSADVESQLGLSAATQHSTATDDKSAYVTDNRKVFVSNVNYRVCQLHIRCVVWLLMLMILA